MCPYHGNQITNVMLSVLEKSVLKDGRSKRRNKAAFFNFYGVVWTGPNMAQKHQIGICAWLTYHRLIQ